MRTVKEWLRWHIEPQHLATPIATVNTIHTIEILPNNEGSIIRGCTHVYVFGIRVMNLQRTAPWAG